MDRWNPGVRAEKRQLLFLAIGAGVIAGVSFGMSDHRVVPTVLGVIAALAACGVLAHRWVGRAVYLTLALLAGVIGAVVSRLVVGLAYLLAIAGFGSLAKLVGMNRLHRDFQACRGLETMLMDVPNTDRESFRRQS